MEALIGQHIYVRHQFEAAARLNKWTEEEKGLSLSLALKGPAAEIIPVSYTHLDVYKRQLSDILCS